MEYIEEARQEYARMDYAAASASQDMANADNLESIATSLLDINLTLEAILKAMVERS